MNQQRFAKNRTPISTFDRSETLDFCMNEAKSAMATIELYTNR